MSDALDDWEQADEVEIQVPVAVPAVVPIKNKIKILSRPTSSSPGSSASINPTVLGSTGGSGGSGFGAGGGTPMILKRNPGSTGGGQQGSSPIARQETNPFGSGNNIYSSRQQRQGVGQRDEDLDDIGEYTRRQMSGLSLRERNRALWDEANAYEQPIIARADTTRTEYVPEIRILRRPKSPVQAVRVSNQVKSKPLAQREADYNAAREKIFGPSPTPSPPINDTLASTTATNFGAAGGGGVRAYSGGAGSPRRQSPSVGGSSSSPNSRPSSRPSSRPGSPSIPHQTVQIYSAGGSTGAFESALETVKPIEFRGGPPPSRRGGGGSSTGGNGSSRGGGQEVAEAVNLEVGEEDEAAVVVAAEQNRWHEEEEEN
ncbi:hypothetical protein EC991_003526 [Linnemannia zychae]|nr:hypothetical protein EC991_003526 [Linnemannia zychae]